MKRARLLAAVFDLAFIAVVAVPAGAQDGPSITVEPATVDTADEHEFTITGTGWSATTPIFVLPCAFPETGSAGDIDADTCDATNLTPATAEDGLFTVTVTFDVPAEGIAIAAGDTDQTEAGAAVVTVSAAQDDDAAETEDEGEAEGGDDAQEAELANTGVESGLLIIVAVAVIAGGTMVVGATRRFV
jgi:hypothetical protein